MHCFLLCMFIEQRSDKHLNGCCGVCHYKAVVTQSSAFLVVCHSWCEMKLCQIRTFVLHLPCVLTFMYVQLVYYGSCLGLQVPRASLAAC